MFENPIKKYQQGGQVSQEQQEMLAAFVEWLPKRVKEFQGMQPEQIVEALNGMSKTPEGQKQVQSLMQQFQQEIQNPQQGMFKDGGKLHDFICKHVKGGAIADCGCQKAEMGAELGGPKNAHVDVPNIPYLKMQLTAKRVPNAGKAVNRNFGASNYKGNQYFLEKATVDGTDAETRFMVIPEKHDTLVDQVINGRHNQLTPEQVEAIMARNRGLMNGVRQQENGGVVKGEKGISRKDALNAAMNAYGFDKNQAQRAYQNAKLGLRNQGLHGKALRQAAREMIAKRPNTNEPVQAIASTEPLQLSVKPETLVGKPVVSAPKQFDLSHLSYNQAFGIATDLKNRGLGSKNFSWRGMISGTNRSSKKQQENNKEVKLPAISDNIEIEDQELIIPTFEKFPIENNIKTWGQQKYPITVAQYTLDPSFWGSDLMSENSVNASANRTADRTGYFTARVKANPVDIDKSVRLATYTKVPVDSSIEGAPISLHYVSNEPKAIPSVVYTPGYQAPGLVKKNDNGGIVKAQGGWKSSENDAIAKGILDQTNPNRGKNIDHITGIRSEQPLIDEHPGLDAALMYAQPTSMFKKPISRVLTKLMAPASYKSMVNGVSNGEGAQAILYGLTPEGEWWEITKRAANLQQGNTKKYTHYKAVGEKETLPYKVAAKNRYRVERGVTPEGEPYRIVPNEINSEVAELRQERRNYWNENSGSDPAKWANSGSGSIKVRGKKIGGKIK